MFKKESFDECEGCISVATCIKVETIQKQINDMGTALDDECRIYNEECCLYTMSSSSCPCKLCLIKTMCLDSCDEFDELYKSLHQIFNERNIRSYE